MKIDKSNLTKIPLFKDKIYQKPILKNPQSFIVYHLKI